MASSLILNKFSEVRENNIKIIRRSWIFMAKNKTKDKNLKKQIENHDTAAWANIDQLKAISQVSIPDVEQVENAKDYVDENQK